MKKINKIMKKKTIFYKSESCERWEEEKKNFKMIKWLLKLETVSILMIEGLSLY